MANLIFNGFQELMAKNDLDWEADVFRILLVRDTTAYTPDVDDTNLDAFTGGGGVEITVASYARQTLASCSITRDDANDQIEFDCTDVAFGNLESGQTVQALLIYQQVGGDDATPATDVIVMYIDTDSGAQLPVALGGGAFTVSLDAEGLMKMSQA